METIEYSISNVDWLYTGIKLAMGILGIMVYVGWKVKDHLAHFDFYKLVRENRVFWFYINREKKK